MANVETTATEDEYDDQDMTLVDDERLELILGPMNSGKSTELGRRLRIKSLYREVVAVNTTKDVRYGSEGIVTHDGTIISCIRVDSLDALRTMPAYRKAHVVAIDEGNFFPEIAQFVTSELKLTNKTFLISGLSGDKDKNFFGTLHELIPHAEKKDFLYAICKRCGNGNRAPFSIDHVRFEGQEKVGGSETYEAVCRKHYDAIRFSQSIDELKRSSPGLRLEV